MKEERDPEDDTTVHNDNRVPHRRGGSAVVDTNDRDIFVESAVIGELRGEEVWHTKYWPSRWRFAERHREVTQKQKTLC